MKKITLALLLLMMGNSISAQDSQDTLSFTPIVENPITSVKNQSRSGTCWAFSSLGFLEAELLRTKKKTYDLCESFLVYNTYLDLSLIHI